MARATARLLAGALTVLLAAPAALVVTPRPAAAALPPVSMIGDSTLLGMTGTGRAIMSASYNVLFDARSCRRLIITSCRGRGVIPPNTIDTMRAYAGRLGDAVVIMAGYDDWYNFDVAVDTIVAEAKRQGVAHVVWLTYRSQGPYVGVGGAYWATYRSFNAILAQKAVQHPELEVADWDTYSLGQSSWFATDGIHISAAGATALANFITASLNRLNLQRCYGGVTGTPTAAPANAVPVTQAPPGGVTPASGRLLDTRSANLPLGAGNSVALPLVAQGRVPAGTTSVFVNLTAVGACRWGYLTAYPCGTPVPVTSNLNVLPGRTRAASASVMLNAQGELCLYSSMVSHVLVDLLGTVSGGGRGLTTTVPDRLVDTRSGAARNGHVGKVGPSAFAVPTAGVGPVPNDAKAVLVNVTAVSPDYDGFVTVHPCGQSTAFSNLNYAAGQTVANSAIVAVDGAGRTCYTSSAPTHLIVDVMGWFTDGAGLRVRAQTPERIIDTRSGLGGWLGVVGAGGTISFPTGGPAMLATVTAVNPLAPGFATAFPCGPRPNASNLNYVTGDVVPNLAVLGQGTGGQSCVYTYAPSHLLVDRAATLVP